MFNRLASKRLRAVLLASAAASVIAMLPGQASAQVLVDIPPGGPMWTVLSAVGRLVSSVRVGLVQTGQQVADASNTVNADFRTSLEEQKIVRNHGITPATCAAVDANQALSVSSRETGVASQTLDATMDQRSEGQPNTNGFYGSAQSAQSANNDHIGLYCSALDEQNGLCKAAQPEWQDRDQRAVSLFGPGTYINGDPEAAQAYLVNLTQPYVPRVPRNGEAKSVAGAALAPERRQYNAAISLANFIGTEILASHSQTVTNLGPDLQQQQRLEGKPVTPNASWFDAMQLEIDRHSTLTYQKQLQRMNDSAVVGREIANLLVLQNSILWQNYKRNDEIALGISALLSNAASTRFEQAEHNNGDSAPFPQAAGN